MQTNTVHPVSARLIIVEPMIFLVEAIQGVLINLRTQYIESRVAESHNYSLPNIGSGNSSCGLNNTNSTANEIQAAIQAETAIWILYLKDTSLFLPMFTATILAASSDHIGRRPIFILGSLCHLLASCLFLLVSLFNLPLWLLVCAEAILGLGGDTVAFEALSLTYICDVYPEKKHAFRFVVLSMIIYIAFGLSQIVIGQILQTTNSFVLSFSCAVILAAINCMYVCIPYFVPESITEVGRIPKDMMKKIFLKYIRLFQKRNSTNNNPILLAITLASDFMYYFIHEAIFVVITIFGIAAPFCWTPTETGIYAAMVNMFPAFCSLVAVKLLSECLNNFWMLHVSLISAVGELLVTAWAHTSAVLLYAAPGVGFLRTLAEAIYKVQLSTLVKADEQAVLFGCQALVASVGKVCSPLVLNTSYAAFVKMGNPQFTFFMAAGFLGIPMILNGILHITAYCRFDGYRECLVDEDEH